MKYLLNFIIKKKDYLIAFALLFLLSFPYVADICSGYLRYSNFDLQEFLLWNYSSINGVIPYKDIFYPYGLLSYFKNYSLNFSLAYYLVLPILFLIIFFAFRKIFKDKLILYFSFAFLYLFVLILTGFQIFSRYGFLMAFSLLFAYIFYSNTNIKGRFFIFLGILLGLLFSIVSDQGVYLMLSFVLLFIFSKYLHAPKNSFLTIGYITRIIREATFIIFGFLIGAIPFLFYLFKNGSIHAYFSYFRNVEDIAVVAKTPFFTFISSPANIFTISILSFAILYNFIKLFISKRNISLLTFFQISLIFAILIMEQKSIVRSIDRQITFVSLTLFMFVLHELASVIWVKFARIIYLLSIATVIILYSFTVKHQPVNFAEIANNYKLLISNQCFNNNLKHFLTSNPSYIKIIKLLSSQQGFNQKIYSFPTGDSSFYILLNQKPPRYNSIFEGASLAGQNLSIKYIQNNDIEYVVLNTSLNSLQDSVPDYIRQNILFEYILNNYSPWVSIDGHLLLRRTGKSDFFASATLNQTAEYNNYLRNIYLYKIPSSEGLYKYDHLKKNSKLLIQSNNVDVINQFLKSNAFYSMNKVIALIPSKDNYSPNLSTLRLQTDKIGSTIAYYDSCKENQACIINLSRIPLLYGGKAIAKVAVDDDFSGKILLFETKRFDYLW